MKLLTSNSYIKDKTYRQLEIIALIQINIEGSSHSVYNLKYSVPKEIPIVFYNGFNYDYYFIIKDKRTNTII